MQNKYKNTIRVYEKLGGKYLENIKDLTPPELYEFINILLEKGKILDVGCAGGRDSRVFLDNGFRVVGIDIVKEFIKEAQRKNPDGKFIIKDLLKLSFKTDSFDGIWAHAVLLHFSSDDVLKILKDFFKILKPQGKLYLGVKEGTGVQGIVDKLSEGEERYFNFFNKKQIKELLERAGFRIIQTKYVFDEAGRKDVRWIRVFTEKQ